MGRITSFAGGKITYSYATSADLERTGASLDECDGLVDVVRSVSGSEVALFEYVDPDGTIIGERLDPRLIEADLAARKAAQAGSGE